MVHARGTDHPEGPNRLLQWKMPPCIAQGGFLHCGGKSGSPWANCERLPQFPRKIVEVPVGLGHWSVPGGASKPRGVATDLQLQCLRIPPIGPVPPKGTGSTGGGLRIIYPHPTYRASGQRVRPPTDWLLPGYPIRNRPGRGGTGAVGWVHLPPHPPPGSSKFGSINCAKTAQDARQFLLLAFAVP